MSLLDCYGQNQAILRLQQARQAHRIPHSYIFHGPEGVGKALLARLWTQVMFCENPQTKAIAHPDAESPDDTSVEITDSCGQCESCRLLIADTHPDLHYITRDLAKYTKKPHKSQLLTLPIDVIREFVINAASGSPIKGKSKVFLIDDAHAMTQAADAATGVIDSNEDVTN